MIRIRFVPVLLAVSTPALAHTGAGAAKSFGTGFLHPMLGLDHVLAMVAVGLWAGLVGGRAVWAWPLSFVLIMVGGAGLGVAGVALPGVETGIALSVLLLGSAVALDRSAPVSIGALVCGAFALFHGYAHGAELLGDAGAGSYVTGFVLATGLLHAAGLGAAVVLKGSSAGWPPRTAGAAVAIAGLVLIMP